MSTTKNLNMYCLKRASRFFPISLSCRDQIPNQEIADRSCPIHRRHFQQIYFKLKACFLFSSNPHLFFIRLSTQKGLIMSGRPQKVLAQPIVCNSLACGLLIQIKLTYLYARVLQNVIFKHLQQVSNCSLLPLTYIL